MSLWCAWLGVVFEFRSAVGNVRTFHWLIIALAGFSIRSERAGVTSIVRVFGLRESSYYCLLRFFHSKALPVEELGNRWLTVALSRFSPLRINGHLVLIGDGIKVAKEGLKMPSVKKLHQSSSNSTKPEYIYGHSHQALGLLVHNARGEPVCVPLVSEIHEGVVFTNRDKRTLHDKLIALALRLRREAQQSILLILDAYYTSGKVIAIGCKGGIHCLIRTRSNAVAYHPAPLPTKPKRGRPRLYGDKVRLRDLWRNSTHWTSAPSPVYGEKNVELRYFSVDLLWRPAGRMVRFVLVEHPRRGRIILLCTDLTMSPLDIIAGYGYRFKIEVTFRQAVHTIGSYAYHFWMRAMKPLSRRKSGNQYLHRETKEYRQQVVRKINAYHRFVQVAFISHGLLQYLALHHPTRVWAHFGSWLRTMRPHLAPSEAVVAHALRNTLLEFLLSLSPDHSLRKFLDEETEPSRAILPIAA